MLSGVALAYCELPLQTIERHGLDARVVARGGEREVQFLWSGSPRVLPVWLPSGHLVLATWGNARGESRHLPAARWASLQTWEEGRWARYNPVPVGVPATLIADGCFDQPVWVSVRQGLRALL